MVDYSIDFRTRARLSTWNAGAQCDAYLNGLGPHVKHQLVSFDLPSSLDGLIELTTRLDQRMQMCFIPVVQAEGALRGGGGLMQVGRTGLSPEERE